MEKEKNNFELTFEDVTKFVRRNALAVFATLGAGYVAEIILGDKIPVFSGHTVPFAVGALTRCARGLY